MSTESAKHEDGPFIFIVCKNKKNATFQEWQNYLLELAR